MGISDAVGTMRTLGVSAWLSLSLPATPSPAPGLTTAVQRTFHVDSTYGDDANDGLSALPAAGTGPWKTLARLSSARLAPGDRIELACGSTWHETLRLPADGAAGAPIVVAQPATGCSTLPAIDGSVALPAGAWSLFQGHVYKAPLSATPLQLFASTGYLTPAHFPSPSDASADPGSPWLALAADSAGATLTTGPDFVLPGGAKLDSTTRVHLRTNAYVIDESTLASFDAVHLTLANAPTYTARAGWGYFLTGQLWMLRAAGQWWYDAASGQVYAWMPDSAAPATALAASTQPVGIDLANRSHIVVDGIAVHGVGLGVDARQTTDVTLRNLLVQDIADIGIDVAGSSLDVIDGCGVARTGSDAVTGWGGAMSPLIPDATGLTARNNIIRESGVRMDGDTVLSLPRRSLAALFIGSHATATGNVVVNSGYIGILAQSQSVVTNNFVYGACSVQDDCGAIYTSGAYNGSQIVGNTVMHSRGSLYGQPLAGRATSAQGIYVDDKGSDLVIQSNTVIDTDDGILLHNAARNAIGSNRLFANRQAQLWMQESTNELDPAGDMSGNRVSDNEFAPVSPTAIGVQLTSSFPSTSRFASFSTNRFYDRISPAVAVNGTSAGRVTLGWGGWTGSTGYGSTQAVDISGTAVSAAGYAVYTPAGGNLVPNGTLANGSTGWTSWNATAPAAQMALATCPAGPCLAYAAGGSASVLSTAGFALQKGAWYRLSVDISTQVDNQVVPMVVRMGSGDYASVSDRPLAFTASRAWQRHTAVFQATQDVTGTGARIDFDGIVAGGSITMGHLELVPIRLATTALNSSAIVNAAATPLSAGCPFAGDTAMLCSQVFDLATGAPVSWPLIVPAYSATLVYVQDPSLRDSDGDGIVDSMDLCPATRPVTAVDASGCPLPSF